MHAENVQKLRKLRISEYQMTCPYIYLLDNCHHDHAGMSWKLRFILQVCSASDNRLCWLSCPTDWLLKETKNPQTISGAPMMNQKPSNPQTTSDHLWSVHNGFNQTTSDHLRSAHNGFKSNTTSDHLRSAHNGFKSNNFRPSQERPQWF